APCSTAAASPPRRASAARASTSSNAPSSRSKPQAPRAGPGRHAARIAATIATPGGPARHPGPARTGGPPSRAFGHGPHPGALGYPWGRLFPQELLYMKKTGLSLALAAALGLGMTACTSTDGPAPGNAEAAAAAALQGNPFVVQSELPLQYPHFDRIKDEHFGPAFDAGMAEQLKEIEAIASNSEEPSFENTIIALENSGQVLNRARAVF